MSASHLPGRVERAQRPFPSLVQLVGLVEVGDEKVGQQKEQGDRYGHDQNNREPGPPASPGGAIHRLLHEHVLPLLRTGQHASHVGLHGRRKGVHLLHPPLRLLDAIQRNIRPLLGDLVTGLPRSPLLLQHLEGRILPGHLALHVLLHLLVGDALPVLLLPELVSLPLLASIEPCREQFGRQVNDLLLNGSLDVVVRIRVGGIQIATMSIGIDQVCERPVQAPFLDDESELGACALDVVCAGQFQGGIPVFVQVPLALLPQAFEPVDGLSAVLLHPRQRVQVEDPGFVAGSVHVERDKRIVNGRVHGCSFRSGNTQERGQPRAMARTGDDPQGGFLCGW